MPLRTLSFQKQFDGYSLRARLQPALLTLLPAALAIFAWAGPGQAWAITLWTLFGSAGGTFLLSIVARNRGKAMEPELWNSWGGAPTTQLLRHSGIANPIMRERWHKHLSKLVGRPFPTQSEEASDPIGADKMYEAGVKILIIKTRDSKTTLTYKENVQYGFCRNLYAMKPFGIALSLLGALASIAAGLWYLHLGRVQLVSWTCTVANLVFAFGWIVIVNSSWVKVAAIAYAERLLESIEKTARVKTTKVTDTGTLK